MDYKLLDITVCWTLLILVPMSKGDNSSNHAIAHDLHEKLFKEYKPQILPICANGPTYVNVTLDIALRQIVNLDEKDQVLKTNVWVRMEWHDCRLKWNSSEHDGIDHLGIPYADVWTPDISLYDSAAEEVMMPGLTEYRAQIYSDGSIKYYFPTVLNSVCRVTVTYFPFDTQKCGLKFGSWSHSQRDIDFYSKSATGDMADYVENNEWKVREMAPNRTVTPYDENFTDINYIIVMTRRSEFYIMTMMFPCILVSAIAAIGFLLPSESGEKVSLEVTVLLSQAVFLLVISDFLPPAADNFPILGTYFAVSMLLVSLSLVMSVLVLNVHHRGDVRGKTVPKWAKRYLLTHPRRCCYESEYFVDQENQSDSSCKQLNIEETNIDSINKQNGTGPVKHSPRPQRSGPNRSGLGSIPQLSDNELPTSLPEILLREQNRTLHQIDRHFAQTDDTDFEREDWQKLARVLDRIFLLLYVICFAIVTIVFILQLSNSTDEIS